MVFFEKSQPAPVCLEIEKNKVSGDYKCGDVLQRLFTDFKNKCYICEQKAPTSVNVEHLRAHKGDKNLKFDWNNLFWACVHCNNTKLDNYPNILDCTNKVDDIELKLKYELVSFPIEQVQITALGDSVQTVETQNLLLAIYNGTTELKKIESANLRNKILEEIEVFNDLLLRYFEDENSEEDLKYYDLKIQEQLDNSSNFTAFKRWIILENNLFRKVFEKYINLR